LILKFKSAHVEYWDQAFKIDNTQHNSSELCAHFSMNVYIKGYYLNIFATLLCKLLIFTFSTISSLADFIVWSIKGFNEVKLNMKRIRKLKYKKNNQLL